MSVNIFPATSNPIKYRIQLLADKSVVLVETSGRESEIFLPELLYGRITLTNVIYSRQPSPQPSEISGIHSTGPPFSTPYRGKSMKRRKLNPALKSDLSANSLSRDGIVSKLHFELKLVSNGNVVLAECNGYESEIFLPHVTSHCVTMKRVSADQLAQYSGSRKSKRKQSASVLTQTDTAAKMAASLAAQADSLSKLLVNPLHSSVTKHNSNAKRKEHKKQRVKIVKKEPQSKLSPVQSKKKHFNREAGDA